MEKMFADRPFKRKFTYQSVNLKNSQVVIFDETTPLSIRNKSVMSSASIPSVFPPVEIDGMELVDGGTFSNLVLNEPIRRCQEEVDDADIIVDVILCLSSVTELKEWSMSDIKWQDAYSMYQRKLQIQTFYGNYEDVLGVSRGYHDVKFRFEIAPTE